MSIDKLAKIINNSSEIQGKKIDALASAIKSKRVVNIEPIIQVKVPPIEMPDIDLPDIHVPEIKIPPIELPEIKVPEIKVPPMPDSVKIKNLKDLKLDVEPIIKALKNIKLRESDDPIDYTLIYDEMMKIMEKPNPDVKELLELSKQFPTKNEIETMINLLDLISGNVISDNKYNKEGRLLVEVDRVGKGGGGDGAVVSTLQQGTDRFGLEVSRGNVPGHNRFAFAGTILDLSSGDGIRDIWTGSGSRNDLTGVKTLYISSTDAGDSATLAVFGKDALYNDLIAFGIISGQSQVQLSADMWKVEAMFVLGTGTFNGTIYVAEADDLTGGVPDDDSKVQLVGIEGFGTGAICNRTIPLGFTAYIDGLTLTPNKGKDITVYLASQSDIQDRIITPTGFELYEAGRDIRFDPPFAIGEKTDLMFLAKTTDENAPVSVLVNGFVVDNNY